MAAPESTTENPASHVLAPDDWTRNWQARIGVKVAALFIWVLMVFAFAGMVYYTQRLEGQLQSNINHDLDALSFRLLATLKQPGQPAAVIRKDLLDILQDEMGHSRFSAIRFVFSGETLMVGITGESDVRHERYLGIQHPPSRENVAAEEWLYVSHPPVAQLLERERDKLVLILVAALTAFGLLLIWTIQNVLAKPLQTLTDATRAVTAGDLDMRIDASRQDEFGHLSRFFNQMLDRIQEQRAELTQEISTRRQAEAELRRHRDELGQLVEMRTRDLAIARDQALQASQAKSAFIANVSHEIRTPLTPIIGFAETMLHDEQDAATRKNLLGSIIRNARHLLNVLNEILDLSKIEANRLDIEHIAVDIPQTLHDIEAIIGLMAREKGLQFFVEFANPIPRRIIGDPTRIKQILLNLSSNAIKFTEKGHVRIMVRHSQEEQKLFLTVSDTGVGIPADKLEHLFKAFSQADSSTTRRFGGTGLGLYISQKLAMLLGGDIRVESTEGVGSKFVVSIATGDVSKEECIKAPNLPHEVATLSGRAYPVPRLDGYVLLAEDTPDNQRLVSYYVARTGARVKLASNGQEAVEFASAEEFDLILMDMQMPVMSGIEAITILRASGNTTPIFALTANAMKEDRETYQIIGCSGYLSKPIEVGNFNEILATHLRPAVQEKIPRADVPDDGYATLVKGFLSSLGDYVRQLRAALNSENQEELRFLVHQLKGMGGSFGYPEITDLARAIESAAKTQNSEQAGALAGQLCALLECLKQDGTTPPG